MPEEKKDRATVSPSQMTVMFGICGISCFYSLQWNKVERKHYTKSVMGTNTMLQYFLVLCI